MATWVIVTSPAAPIPIPRDLTNFQAAMGDWSTIHTTEPRAEIRARTAYTLADMWLRIQANDLTGSTTVRSRRNGANGNQSVSIGAGVTGIFEDTVNSDSIAVGDRFNSQIITGTAPMAGDQLQFSPGISYTLDDSSGDASIISANSEVEKLRGTTRFIAVAGEITTNTTEAFGQYTLRVGATFSNIRIFILVNGLSGSSTLTFRDTGANGNQTVPIGAGLTGAFEDTTNSDTLTSGDTLGIQLVVGAGSHNNDMTFTLTQLQMDSAGRITTQGRAQGTINSPSTETAFSSPEGRPVNITGGSKIVATEIDARAAFDALNYFVRLELNTFDAAVTYDFQLNDSATALGVSVGAGLTGTFEDTVSSVSVAVSDTYGHINDDTAATTGSVTQPYVGFQTDQPVVLDDMSWYPSDPQGIQRRVEVLAY